MSPNPVGETERSYYICALTQKSRGIRLEKLVPVITHLIGMMTQGCCRGHKQARPKLDAVLWEYGDAPFTQYSTERCRGVERTNSDS